MRKVAIVVIAALVAVTAGHTSAPKTWSLNATAIEACSCPMFCQCYFNPMPAGHHEQGGMKHYCHFNMAYKVNKGSFGDVKLDGAKFWISGDLGEAFGGGETDWAVVTFDKSTTKEQREALGSILPHVFAVKWKSFQTAEGSVDTWQANKDSAHATLDGGKTAEITLKRYAGNTNDPIVIRNLKYWSVPRNDGFVLMPNQMEAYRTGANAFEHKDSNGFIITWDINSKDVKQ